MKNPDVYISESFFLNLTFLGKGKQSIIYSISIFRIIIEWKMNSREFLGLVELTTDQVFCIYELKEVVIVSNNEHFLFVAF